jgi:beta-ketoacyl synthase-like protein
MVRLLDAGATAETAALPPLRYAGIAGRQLHLLARGFPALGGVVGVYHALGDEKVPLNARACAQIVAGGFDSFKPASVVFEHSAQGPFAQLAISFGLVGPFHILEAGPLSGALALVTAASDLAAGRCEQALVGGFTVEPARAWLLLLDAGPGLRLAWRFRRAHAAAPPADDPLALAAIAAALGAGAAARLVFAAADGRGVEIELAPGSS